MFHFPGSALFIIKIKVVEVYSTGFPHSEISGSKVAKHLPEAYRSNATSFIASYSQGIHRTPLNFLLRNLKTTTSRITREENKALKKLYPDRSGLKYFQNFYLSEFLKTSLNLLDKLFNFQSVKRPDFLTKKPPFKAAYRQKKESVRAYLLNCFSLYSY